MTNDHSEEFDIDLDVEETESQESEESTAEERTNDSNESEKKPTETLEARRARLLRQLKQTESKLGLNSERKQMQTSTPNDLGEAAFLIANGLKESDERALAKKLAKETGKDLETLLNTTYFQTELNALRTANATPTGNRRSNNSSTDTVEYWIAKGDLPPASEVELRRKVVNARMKKEESRGQFYNS